jgi:predicted nucleic acid-binding protein
VPFVLDASVATSWFFPDEDHPDARAAWHIVRSDIALVPLHWWFEVRNAMLIGERRGRCTEEHTTGALSRLVRMTIRQTTLPHDTDVYLLARRYRLTFYDAAYLELAKREGVALATLDQQLADAARAEGVALVAAAP